MSSNIDKIIIPENEWIDLYTLAGIPVGTAIAVENVGSADVRLAVSQTQPPQDHQAYNVIRRDQEVLRNSAGDAGAWAYCQSSGGAISVRAAGGRSPQGFRPAIDAGLEQGLGAGINKDAWGVQLIERRKNLFKSLFTFDVPAKKFEARLNGTELNLLLDAAFQPQNPYVFSSGGMLNVTTDGVASSFAFIHSRRHPQYQADRGHRYSDNIMVPTPTDNADEEWGLITEDDGVYFRCSKLTGELRAVIKSDGVEWYDQPIDLTGPEFVGFDLSKNNIFDIQFQWRSAGDFFFYVGSPVTGLPTLVHHAKLLGTLAGPSIRNPSLSAGFLVRSYGDAGLIKCSCVDISSEGGTDGSLQYESAASGPIGPTTANEAILAIRSPLLLNGRINTRDLLLSRIRTSTDKKVDFNIYITRDPTAITLAGGAAWKRVTGGSYVEYVADGDISTVDTTKMELLLPVSAQASTTVITDSPDPDRIPFWIIHGDIIVIVCKDSGATVSSVIEWGEEI